MFRFYVVVTNESDQLTRVGPKETAIGERSILTFHLKELM